MQVYFVRHGESEANVLHEFSNWGLKHGLTPRGRDQTQTLATRLAGLSDARLYTSPILRAMQTADMLAQAWGARFRVTEALREYDVGVWEGRTDPAGWAEHDAVYAAWLRGEWEQRTGGGESFLDIRDRFIPFIQDLVRAYQDTEAALVLVSHGGLYRCMLPLVLTNITPQFAAATPIGNADFVLATNTSDGLRCVEWGGRSIPLTL